METDSELASVSRSRGHVLLLHIEGFPSLPPSSTSFPPLPVLTGKEYVFPPMSVDAIHDPIAVSTDGILDAIDVIFDVMISANAAATTTAVYAAAAPPTRTVVAATAAPAATAAATAAAASIPQFLV